MNSWFLHSKFKLTIGTFVVSLALLLAGVIKAEDWLSYTKWIIGLYFASDVATIAVTKKVSDVDAG